MFQVGVLVQLRRVHISDDQVAPNKRGAPAPGAELGVKPGVFRDLLKARVANAAYHGYCFRWRNCAG